MPRRSFARATGVWEKEPGSGIWWVRYRENGVLHPEKTRLIEFGRHAAANRKRLGLGKPETFDFLGFKHICGKTKRGRFLCFGRRFASACRRRCCASRSSCDGECMILFLKLAIG